MKKIDSLNQVGMFHKVFNHPILPIPEIPSKERCELRIRLIEEELQELKDAIEQGQITEVADAFCDIQYVLTGAVLEFGFGNLFVDLFNEVQRSNMSKACSTLEEAQESLEYYKANNIDAYYERVGNKFIIYRSDDNKILKSKFYSEANLESILKSQIS